VAGRNRRDASVRAGRISPGPLSYNRKLIPRILRIQAQQFPNALALDHGNQSVITDRPGGDDALLAIK
jgi:hypothetical protein